MKRPSVSQMRGGSPLSSRRARAKSERGLLSPGAPFRRRPSVSIVIPAYNEEGQLTLCLNAIAKQTVRPLEVLVVDNNSTDATVAIAQRYPFVTVLREQKQGPAYARDRGFNAVRGDIIGRLDADSVIAPDWVENVHKIFEDQDIRAVSGQMTYRDVSIPELFNAIDRRVRWYLTLRMGSQGEQFLLGSNMAIRRRTWQRVKNKVCHKRHLHEDIDLAAHLAGANSGVVFRPELVVSQNWRQAAAGPRQFLHHVWSNVRVLTEHDVKSRRYARHVAVFVSLLYVPIHLLYQGYNPKTQRFSLRYFMNNTAPVRVSPVSESL